MVGLNWFTEVPAAETAMPPSLRVAAVQSRSSRDPSSNLARINQHIRERAAQRVRVVVFPECALSDRLFRTVLAGVGLLLAWPAVADAAATRPNVLWITREDTSPHLRCYGDGYAITPNLDRFATEGIRYAQAFASTGVCAPSRSCLITGVYPTRLGSHHMRSATRLPEPVK
jgi:hypothetical protein